jgi:Glycosyltransferase family 87
MGLRFFLLLRVGALTLLVATCASAASSEALAAAPGSTRSPTPTSLLETSSVGRGGHAQQSEKETTVVFKQTTSTTSNTTATNPETPVPVEASDTPPVGRHLSSDEALEIANRLPKMKAVRAKYKGSYGGAYLKGPTRWQVSYFSKQGKEIGQVIIADHNGKVLEQWTGFQIAWSMARGYPGAFGRHVNALYIWIPLCVLFFVPFFNWRKPLRLLHLDLLVLLSFSVSLAYFNHAHIYASTPLVYPPLVYLLVRMLALARVGRRGPPSREPRPLRLVVPAPWLAIGVVFLIGFRIGLNVTDSNVIDVGYAGVIGAQRIAQDKALYGNYPSDNEHGDTYGPVNYEAYVPFQQTFGWSGHWDDLPAAHAAAIVFDLLAIALLFLLGRRVRGPGLGIVLAYAWVSYPFTLFALESNSNDSLVAVLILAALLVASSPPARGMFAALAGLTKFAPLALAPLLWTHGIDGLSARARARALALFALAFVVTVAVVSIPALTHDSLHTIYERTLAYQSNRESPFSIWGLYGNLGYLQAAVQGAALALALSLAVLPRRRDLIGLAGAAAAVLIAVQLGIEHWFYLYIPWFFGLAMLALLGQVSLPEREPAAPSGSARSSQLAAA